LSILLGYLKKIILELSFIVKHASAGQKLYILYKGESNTFMIDQTLLEKENYLNEA